MSENVTTKFRVDISDLKKNISDANRQIRQYKAELQNASAGMKKGEENADSLTKKVEAQSKIVEAEKAKLQALRDELSRYEEKVRQGESTVADLTRKHEEAARAFGEDSAEAKALAEQLRKAQEAQERNTRAAEELRTKIVQQDTAVKNAEGQVRTYSTALDSLQREEQEADNAAGKLSAGVKETGEAAEKTTSGGLNAFAVALGNLASQVIVKAVQKLGELTRSVIETGKAFDTSMSNVQAISGAVAEEDLPAIAELAKSMGVAFEEGATATETAMNILEAKAEKMGATTKFTAKETADAFGYMAMAGWKAEEMLGGIDGVMGLAAASGADLAETSDIVTDSLTAFGKSAEDAGRLADIMAAAAANSNTNVSMMGETFKYAASLAGSMGYSMEDTAIATGLMANSGIKATQAGTSLRALMTRMAAPTKDSATAMAALGLKLDDGRGNMKSLMEVMQDLRRSFGSLKMSQSELTAEQTKLNAALESGEMDEDEFNDAQEELIARAYGAEGAMKAQYASMLAGKNGLSGFLAIVNASDADFDKLTESIYNSEGAAQAMAETMLDNLGGSLTLLSSAFDGFKKQLYDSFSAPLNGLVQEVTGQVMPALSALADGVPGASDKLADALSNLVSNALGELNTLLPRAVELLGGVLGAVGTAMARQAPEAVRGAVALLEQIMDGIMDALPDMIRGAGRMLRAILDGLSGLVPHLLDSIADALPDALDALLDTVPVILRAVLRLAERIAERLPEVITKLVTYLPRLVEGLADFLVEQTPVILRAVLGIVRGIIAALPDILEAVVQAAPEILTAVAEMVPDLLEAVIDALIENADLLIGTLTEVLVRVAEQLPEILQVITETLPSLLEMLGVRLVELVPVLLEAVDRMVRELADALPEILQALWDALTVMLDPVARIMADAWLEIEDGVRRAGEFFAGVWKEAVADTEQAIGGIADFFTGVWEEAVANVESVIGGIADFFRTLWDELKTSVTELGEKIGDAVGGAVKGAVNAALEYLEERLNAVPDAINGALDVLNKLPGVDIPRMDRIELPRLARGGIFDRATIAEIGEAGREAVIPLDRDKAGLREVAKALREELEDVSAGMHGTTNITNAGRTTNVNYVQNISSPKALSRYEIWRQSKNAADLLRAQIQGG